MFGDGEQTRSFCYVDDLIRGLVSLMETRPDVIGPINLGNPDEFTMRQLAELILELTGSRSKIVHRPLPQDDPARGTRHQRGGEGAWLAPRHLAEEGSAKTIPYFEELLSQRDVAEAVRL